MPLVGFLPATDERFVSTVEAIRRELTVDGLVLRYRSREDGAVDGLPPGEGVFLPCSFWLADVLALQGKFDEARELFERLLDLRNDVGLLAEEYDPVAGRQLGNFPQAFTHLAVVNTALVLGEGRGIRPATAELLLERVEHAARGSDLRPRRGAHRLRAGMGRRPLGSSWTEQGGHWHDRAQRL